MNDKPLRILFDTNIWLDFYLGSRTYHKDAMALYDAAKTNGADVLCAFVSLKDVYYLIDASLKREARASNGELAEEDAQSIQMLAWECVKNMLVCSTPIGADISDAWHASKLQRIHGDFEDDLIIAAARRSNCDYLVTNDRQLLSNAPVNAISSKDALILLSHND